MNGDEAQSVVALVVTGVVLGLSGGLMVWLARKGRNGTLRRNQIAGVRTALTLSSDAAWYPAQRASARSTATAGWGSIVAGTMTATLGFWGMPFDTTIALAVFLTLGGCAWLLGWALIGASAAQRAARDAVTRLASCPPNGLHCPPNGGRGL